MTRQYTPFATEDKDVQRALDTLLDSQLPPEQYKEVLKEIGRHLGRLIVAKFSQNKPRIYLACTVEDADFLATGILEVLYKKSEFFAGIKLACFWNDRFDPFGIKDAHTTPILRSYKEKTEQDIDLLIVLKSIINGACVVKTNLTDVIENIHPEKILIMAPVMFNQAEALLKKEFSEDICNKFEFIAYALDDKENDEITPGVGGNLYQRLGFKDQEDKNRFTPALVKERRRKLLESSV